MRAAASQRALSQALPLRLILHLVSPPTEKLMLAPSPEACKQAFMGQLKEADFIRWGNTKRITGLRKAEQDGIWESIKERTSTPSSSPRLAISNPLDTRQFRGVLAHSFKSNPRRFIRTSHRLSWKQLHARPSTLNRCRRCPRTRQRVRRALHPSQDLSSRWTVHPGIGSTAPRRRQVLRSHPTLTLTNPFVQALRTHYITSCLLICLYYSPHVHPRPHRRGLINQPPNWHML